MTTDSTEPTEPTEPTISLDPPAEETRPVVPVAEPTPPAYVPHIPSPAVEIAAAPAAPAAPRVRWAGIVWGAVFALLAATALWVLAEASRIEALGEWLRTLAPGEFSPGWVIGIVVLAGGVLLLLLGGLALIRNAQLRATVER